MSREEFKILTSEFVTSSASGKDLLEDNLKQIVFTGKSNVGKSSLINSLLGRKNLARTGKTPGKTRLINYFLINSGFYFVDIPGYGYAEVSKTEKDKWQKMINEYFKRTQNLKLAFSILDIRHFPGKNDLVLIEMFESLGIPQVIILNKKDKLSNNQIYIQMQMFNKALCRMSSVLDIIPYSSIAHSNRDKVLDHINNVIGETE